MIAELRALLLRQLPATPRRLCIALSGGLDSTLLLSLLCELRQPLALRLRAVHIDHGLHPDSRQWARATRARARAAGVPCRVLRAEIRVARGDSLEAAARAERYRLLNDLLAPGEWLVTAHHQDDQAETLLLQWLRGSGVSGLAAMGVAGRGAIGSGRLLRPLLGQTRDQLRAEAARRGLEWSEDPSNEDPRFDRNYLRMQVLPLLRARWPGLSTTLARSAALAAEASASVELQAAIDLGHCADGRGLRASSLRCLPSNRRREVLRLWLRRAGAPMPDRSRLKELAGSLLEARADSQPEVAWAAVSVRRHDDRLHLLARHPSPLPAAQAWQWRRQRRLEVPGIGVLELRRDLHGDLDLAALPAMLAVRFRRGGERLATRNGQVDLGQWLQQLRMPPWQRARLPLLYAGSRLLAVGDGWLHPQLRWREGQAGRRARGRLRFLGGPDAELLTCPPVVI